MLQKSGSICECGDLQCIKTLLSLQLVKVTALRHIHETAWEKYLSNGKTTKDYATFDKAWHDWFVQVRYAQQIRDRLHE